MFIHPPPGFAAVFVTTLQRRAVFVVGTITSAARGHFCRKETLQQMDPIRPNKVHAICGACPDRILHTMCSKLEFHNHSVYWEQIFANACFLYSGKR